MRGGLSFSVLVLVSLIGCSAAPTPAPSLGPVTAAPLTPPPTSAGPALSIETAPPPSAPIRTVDLSGGGSTPVACPGVGLTGATLQGDATDPRVAWLDVRDYGARGVLFPKGFTARFTPNLEILDWSGHVRFRAGDAIDGGCVWGQGDLLIGWP